MKTTGPQQATKQSHVPGSSLEHSSQRHAPSAQFLADSPRIAAQRRKINETFGPAIQRQSKNETGLPDNLKSGVESLSGISMDAVRVHYNSAKPAQLNALAYAQGNDIHLGSGQEKHLPHEAWHVVQQAQGRVMPTMQMKDGVPVNDDAGLEHEADVMGAKAASGVSMEGARAASAPLSEAIHSSPRIPAQRKQLVALFGNSVVQKRDMRAVMIDQRAREKKTKEKGFAGGLTTVGFEWDVAETAEHTEENPNVLQGLTHVELAESDLKWNGLHYLLETDAGNVLEFVSPPFYLKTQGEGSSLPDPADLNDIIVSTRAALAGLVAKDETLDQLMAKSWAAFVIAAWGKKDLGTSVTWRNWHPRAQSKENIEAGLPAWGSVRIAKVTTSQQPQINIAATSSDYREAQKSGGSRLGAKDTIVSRVTKLTATINQNVASGVRNSLKEDEAGTRVKALLDRVVEVLAQQFVIADIKGLADLQKRGYDSGEDVGNAMRKASGAPSYIKDTGVVWLKTDLFSYALGVLKMDDWALLAEEKGVLGKMLNKLTPGKLGKDVDTAPMTAVLQNLQRHANALARMGEKGKKGKYIQEQFLAIGKGLPGFNEHNPEIIGVRQDTFIKPMIMNELSRRLGFKSLLAVMEIRNTDEFLKWLAKGEKSKSKSGSGSKGDEPELVAAPTIDVEGVTLRANETDGDGNCFFHALYESINKARSNTGLQQAIRLSVLDALAGNEAIAASHFGAQGIESPEYQFFAVEILTEGAWVTDQTPAIVSDALNMRIVIHNVDGSVYFDAQPNPTFEHENDLTTVHVQYTGNHYNSYTHEPLRE